MPTPPTLSIVVPVYNEEESIGALSTQLRAVLDGMDERYEVIFVNDGSSDGSRAALASLGWKQARVVNFVSNSGHMAALDAGYRAAGGDWVLTMDSDLQHPPRLIPTMLDEARAHNVDVVYAVRDSRQQEGLLKRMAAPAYYRLMRGLTDVDVQDSAADFRLLSKRVVRILQQLPPGGQVFRLLVPSLGFPSRTITFPPDERFAGTTKYTFRKLIGLSSDSVLGFSTKPLTVSIRVGFVVSILAVLGFVFVTISYMTGHSVQGWASVFASILLLFGVLFVLLGVLGFYVGAILRQLLDRPRYIVDEHEPPRP